MFSLLSHYPESAVNAVLILGKSASKSQLSDALTLLKTINNGWCFNHCTYCGSEDIFTEPNQKPTLSVYESKKFIKKLKSSLTSCKNVFSKFLNTVLDAFYHAIDLI